MISLGMLFQSNLLNIFYIIAFHSSPRRPGGDAYQGFQFKAYSSSSLGESGGCGGYFHGSQG